MLLNNQQITEEIKKEIKICIETNENENTTTQNLWDTVKAVQGSNRGLLHCRWILNLLSHQGSTLGIMPTFKTKQTER